MMLRLIWTDSLKGWLFIFIVLGHAIQYTLRDSYNDNHYSFHMPAFMAISDYLSLRVGAKSRLSVVYRRFLQ